MSSTGRIEESLITVSIMGDLFKGRLWINSESTRIEDIRTYAENTLWSGWNLCRIIANAIADEFPDDVNACEIKSTINGQCELTYNNWP